MNDFVHDVVAVLEVVEMEQGQRLGGDGFPQHALQARLDVVRVRVAHSIQHLDSFQDESFGGEYNTHSHSAFFPLFTLTPIPSIHSVHT
jgi:hypothetical protein